MLTRNLPKSKDNNLKIMTSTGIFKLKKELETLKLSVLETSSHCKDTQFLYIISPSGLENLWKLFTFSNRNTSKRTF